MSFRNIVQEAIHRYFEPVLAGFDVARSIVRATFGARTHPQRIERSCAYERLPSKHWPELDVLVRRLLDEQDSAAPIRGVTLVWCAFGNAQPLQQAFRRLTRKHPPIQAISRFHVFADDVDAAAQAFSASRRGVCYYIVWLSAPLTDKVQQWVVWAARGAASGEVFPIAGSAACLKSLRAEHCNEYFDAVSVDESSTWEILDRVMELKLSEFMAVVPTLFPSEDRVSKIELQEKAAGDNCPALHIPRYRVREFAQLLLASDKYQKCIQPLVLDLQHDYLSAIRRCDERSAIWIWLRGNALILLATLKTALIPRMWKISTHRKQH